MKLNKPQKVHYVDIGGVRCPYCNSGNISPNGPMLGNVHGAQQKIVCLQCGRKWVDIYTLNDIEEIER